MARVTLILILLKISSDMSAGQNYTDDTVHNAAGQFLLAIQRVNERLTAIETLLNQQMRKLDLIDYKMTKMEVLTQDRGNEKDKNGNNVLVKKIDDLEWEIHKFGTLLDVVRGDLDKIHQRQTELKVVASGGSSLSKKKSGDDESNASEIAAKIQVMSGHLNALRRMNEAILVHLQSYGIGINNVSNITRELFTSSKQFLTKNYFQQTLKEELEAKPTIQMMSSPHCEQSTSTPHVQDCTGWLEIGKNQSGVYQIRPNGSREAFFVWCDMETDGGGWTVFQKRFEGSIDFYQEWPEYKIGFGNIAGEHWLGNDKLHLITKNSIQRLRIEMQDMDNDKVTAEYSAFAVGSQSSAYAILVLGSYQGEAGDSFSYHVGMKFSTKDVDNDQWEGGSCAEDHKGGWWYKGCDMSNLNGLYLSGTTPEDMQYRGMYWYEWHGPAYSVQKTTMMIRPANY